MIVVRAAALVALLSIGTAGIAGNASARTPTPTSTPAPTVTPAPPQPALFNIFPWVDGQEGAHDVIAKIGETTCATGVPGVGTVRPNYQLLVPSEEVVPGCGREGAVVTFIVDGRQASLTAIWRSGGSGDPSRILTVIVGPPFARFSGGAGPGRLSPGQVILPYVGNAPCGHAEAGGAPGYGYEAVVYSAEQQAGCGVEGSQVTFKLLDPQGNVIAVDRETGTWHAWDGVSYPQQVDLTFGPAGGITMPGTGDKPGGASPWLPLSVGLALVGLAGGIGGFALRGRWVMR